MDIIVVNGFLGSGKTSTITHILERNSEYRFALLINEFGSHDVDGKQLEALNEHIISINNGSIFCSCKSDKFVSAMLELSGLDIDVILVESSGFSNPASLLRLLDFIVDKSSNPYLSVKNIISIVCPLQFEKLINTSTTYVNQVSISDYIVLNKTDLVSVSESSYIVSQIKHINEEATIYKTKFGQIDYSALPDRKYRSNHLFEMLDSKDLSQQRVTFTLNSGISKHVLYQSLKECAKHSLRIKGLMSCIEGNFSVQVASGQIMLSPSAFSDNKLVILYSSYMDSREKITDILMKYNLINDEQI